MRIGLDIARFDGDVAPFGTHEAIALMRDAERRTFDTAWVPVLSGGPDPLTVCALAASAGVGLELATGVVRIWSHHPIDLTRAAMTVADVADGGVVLGVGVGHAPSLRAMYGLDAPRPVAHFAEYLGILRALIDTGEVSFDGAHLTAHVFLDRRHPPGRLLLGAAAGGPRMLATAATYADVVITNLAGPRVLAERSIPTIVEAAGRAGRPTPRIAAIFNVCVTGDVPSAREHVDGVFARYGRNPDYRALLDAEGAVASSDVALIGDEQTVARRLDELAATGLTDLVVSVVAPDADAVRATEHFLSLWAAGRPDHSSGGVPRESPER